MPTDDADIQLKRGLDRCVKCGMCLPECPTYRLAADENESPRGRLALIEGLVDGRIAAGPAVTRHLDNCLLCRRCERVCPSQVRYGELFDAGRAHLPARPGGMTRKLLTSPRVIGMAADLAGATPVGWTRHFPALHRMHRLASALVRGDGPPTAGHYPALNQPASTRVGLFSGCTGAAFQPGLLQAAVHLLQRVGCDVLLPSRPGCCGALAAHAGDHVQAQTLAAESRELFADGVAAIVSVASGCGIHLDGYRPPLPAPHTDICDFLSGHEGLSALRFKPLNADVALHVPCSVDNVYRGAHWADSLLRRIPAIRLQRVGAPGQCCGAAGDHVLRRPETADLLRTPLLAEVAAMQATILVSSNVGCTMHLAEGLDGALEVMHPVELLARQLADFTPSAGDPG